MDKKWQDLYQAFLIVGGTHEQRFKFMMDAYKIVIESGIPMGGISFASTDQYVDGDKIQRAISQAGSMLDRVTSVAKFLGSYEFNIAIVCDSPLEMDAVNEIKNEPFGGIDLWKECVEMQPSISNYGYVISIDNETHIKDIDGSEIDEERVLPMKNSPKMLAALMTAIGCDENAIRNGW